MLRKSLFALLVIFCANRLCVWSEIASPLLESTHFSTEIVDRDGELLRLSISDDQIYRLHTKLGDISPLARKATLLYEDRYFYYHPGINPFSIARAFWVTYIKKNRVLGASTITMQLSRSLFNINSKSPLGKVKQIIKALQIEFFHSKEEILEAYFNLVPYGFNIEGIGAASRIYFNKNAHRLSLLESLTLSVIPQSPYERTQHLRTSKLANHALKTARNQVLQQWLKTYPTNVEKKLDFDLELGMRHPRDLPFLAPHLVSRILQSKKSGKVRTNLNLNIQKALEKTAKNYIARNTEIGIKNMAALLVDTNNMEALAYLGSADFFNDDISGQVDGVQARRSPGSALKPFAYALAIDQGNIHPYTMIKDSPAPFGTYTPDNFDHAFAGPLSATDALIHSRNIPAIHVAQDLEDPNLHEFLLNAGVPLNPDSKHYGLSIVLGTAEVTMEELIELYSSFNNNGVKKKVRIEANDPTDEGKFLLSPESSYLILEMLSKNPRPKGGNDEKWRVHPRSVAWKTGTSVGFRDAWAISVFDHYALAVWVGNFSGQGNSAFVGRHASGPLLFSMIEALAKVEQLNFPEPAPSAELKLTEVDFCALSGLLPNKHCPHTKRGNFIPGTSPISTCQVHREVEIDLATGHQACPKLKGQTSKKVYEYWSTDLLQLFKQAGIGRKTPPQMHKSCAGEVYGDIGPRIVSPKKEITYHLRSEGSDSKNIPLLAIADGNVKNITWYINNKPVGVSDVSDPLIWTAKSGRHTARAIDEQGRVAEVAFVVEWVD